MFEWAPDTKKSCEDALVRLASDLEGFGQISIMGIANDGTYMLRRYTRPPFSDITALGMLRYAEYSILMDSQKDRDFDVDAGQLGDGNAD